MQLTTGPMGRVSTLVSADIGDYLTNVKTWKNVMYNVLEHGLVGDGVTDDTAALQTLINTAIAAGRRTIFFPHTPTGGKYFVTALTNASQVDFIGDNCSFVGGYTGTITNMGDNAALEAEFAKEVPTVYNVKGYGATGDGVTDDTQAFKNAIAAVSLYEGILYIPHGTYRITDQLFIQNSMRVMGEFSSFNGVSLLRFYMDGKPLSTAAIRVGNSVNYFKMEYLYVQNMGTERRDGIHLNGTGNTNSFCSINNVISKGWRMGFYISIGWVMSFRDCYAGANSVAGFYVDGLTTTVLFDHCYSESADYGYFMTGAYYATFLNCATDFCRIGFNIDQSRVVSMIGCGCEGAHDYAINVTAAAVTIDGFTSVGNGDNLTNPPFIPTILNATSGSIIHARGIYETSLPAGNNKTLSIALGADTIGDIVTCREMLGISYPKNGRFLFNGQAFTTGLPTAIGWLATDIGKVVYESSPVEAGTSPNKYVKLGYQRLTAGNGNVLNTDWLALRALTGN